MIVHSKTQQEIQEFLEIIGATADSFCNKHKLDLDTFDGMLAAEEVPHRFCYAISRTLQAEVRSYVGQETARLKKLKGSVEEAFVSSLMQASSASVAGTSEGAISSKIVSVRTSSIFRVAPETQKEPSSHKCGSQTPQSELRGAIKTIEEKIESEAPIPKPDIVRMAPKVIYKPRAAADWKKIKHVALNFVGENLYGNSEKQIEAYLLQGTTPLDAWKASMRTVFRSLRDMRKPNIIDHILESGHTDTATLLIAGYDVLAQIPQSDCNGVHARLRRLCRNLPRYIS